MFENTIINRSKLILLTTPTVHNMNNSMHIININNNISEKNIIY